MSDDEWLSPSAHVDTFARDNLPPREQWPELLFDLPSLQFPVRLNAAVELIGRGREIAGPDGLAVAAEGVQWTYAEVDRLSDQVAQVLVEDQHLVPGERVLIRGPNAPWYAAIWLGVLKAGGVVVGTMAMLRRHEIATIVSLTKPRIALCDHRLLDEISGIDTLQVIQYGDRDFDDTVSRKPGGFVPIATAADDVAMLATTSGTTGVPKVAAHFHRDILATAVTFGAEVLKLEQSDVVLTTAPFAFTFGLGGLLIFPFAAGASVYLVEKATPLEIAEIIAAQKISCLFTAPTAYRAMLLAGKATALGPLRLAVSAGETLSGTTWQAFKDQTGVSIIDGIGSTELLHIFIACAGTDIRPGATGKAVPGYVAALLDDDDDEIVGVGEGRLAVRGPTGCRYLADDRQAAYVRNGWNLTGDTYRRDSDGYYIYRARSDDMIVSSGYNIAAPEVETAILGHLDVVECAVIGTPDPTRGQLVTAFVVPRDGVAPSQQLAQEIQQFVKSTIAPYKYPRRVEFIEALPKTPTGKVQRFLLRKTAE